MAAVDSSTLIAFIGGDQGDDVALFVAKAAAGGIALPPAVLAEVLSDPRLPDEHRRVILELPLLAVLDGFWLRVAAIRAVLLSRRLRARLADALIAQSCIDHDVALITRDRDFRHFADHCGLKLA